MYLLRCPEFQMSTSSTTAPSRNVPGHSSTMLKSWWHPQKDRPGECQRPKTCHPKAVFRRPWVSHPLEHANGCWQHPGSYFLDPASVKYDQGSSKFHILWQLPILKWKTRISSGHLEDFLQQHRYSTGAVCGSNRYSLRDQLTHKQTCVSQGDRARP